jgi:hypothetical protein
MDVFAEPISGGGEVQFALGLGVGGEPVLAVNLLVVGGEGRLQVFLAGARVLGNGLPLMRTI